MPPQPRGFPTGVAARSRSVKAGTAEANSAVNALSTPPLRSACIRSRLVPTKTQVSWSFVGINPAADDAA